jgi:formate dehydrogenase alpha subunit
MVEEIEKIGNEISITIDGRNINCTPGTSILDAASENGIKIPTLCHHPHLKPIGACRLCLVEDEKSGRIMASCVTPASPDMTILTDSPTIKRYRTNIISLMIANHPESCILCNQGNRCELRRIAAELGVGEIGLYPMPHYIGLEEANPFIIRDLSKCILCGKCIRSDHELVAVGAIEYNLRGFRSRPSTVHEAPLEQSSCTFCGTCVSMCPTGALLAKNTQHVGSPQIESSTICGFCGVGCSLVMGSVDGLVMDVNPSHQDDTVNRSTLCVRGHFAHDFLNVSERLTVPLIRKEGELSPTTWDEALEVIAERLLSIKKQNGPQSLGFLGSSKCTVEENYLFQKMARVIAGTNNVDNGSYCSGRTMISHIDERLDGGARVNPLDGLEKAEIIFVIGANPTQSAPVVAYSIKRATRQKGVPLIVADPRKTDLTPFSSLWLPLATQSDCELIQGIAALLFKRKSYDIDFINRFTEGFDSYRSSLSSIDLERVYRVTGLDNETMERAVDLIEGRKMAFVVGQGILQQRYGTYSMDALLNLALMTGSLGGDGKGLYLLSKENNQFGAWDMGAVPDYLPGGQSVQNDSIRKYWEQHWEVNLSPDPGLNTVRMIEEAEKGNMRALYIMGENPLRSLPQPERINKALSKLELLVVQDILTNETVDIADVVLPGAAFSEKDGSFTNLEGRVQCFEPVVSPPGEAKTDWEILDLLFTSMGSSRAYSSLQKIREEISQLVPMYRDLEHHEEAFWIRETSKRRLFHPSGEGDPIPFAPVISTEERRGDESYPFKAILGSLRYHLGSGTRTGYSARIKDFALRGGAEISPEDGVRLNLKDGDKIKISSPHGTISREVALTEDLSPGIIFIPIAFQNNDARHLVELSQIGEMDSSGSKECFVKIEKMEG